MNITDLQQRITDEGLHLTYLEARGLLHLLEEKEMSYWVEDAQSEADFLDEPLFQYEVNSEPIMREKDMPRCSFFTGTPPNWSDAPKDAEYLVQSRNGVYSWFAEKPHIEIMAAKAFWCSENGILPYSFENPQGGPPNPYWMDAIEKRPEWV